MNTIPDKASIEEAHERIKDYIHRTPVLTSASIDEMAGCSIFFKAKIFKRLVLSRHAVQ